MVHVKFSIPAVWIFCNYLDFKSICLISAHVKRMRKEADKMYLFTFREKNYTGIVIDSVRFEI